MIPFFPLGRDCLFVQLCFLTKYLLNELDEGLSRCEKILYVQPMASSRVRWILGCVNWERQKSHLRNFEDLSFCLCTSSVNISKYQNISKICLSITIKPLSDGLSWRWSIKIFKYKFLWFGGLNGCELKILINLQKNVQYFTVHVA